MLSEIKKNDKKSSPVMKSMLAAKIFDNGNFAATSYYIDASGYIHILDRSLK